MFLFPILSNVFTQTPHLPLSPWLSDLTCPAVGVPVLLYPSSKFVRQCTSYGIPPSGAPVSPPPHMPNLAGLNPPLLPHGPNSHGPLWQELQEAESQGAR